MPPIQEIGSNSKCYVANDLWVIERLTECLRLNFEKLLQAITLADIEALLPWSVALPKATPRVAPDPPIVKRKQMRADQDVGGALTPPRPAGASRGGYPRRAQRAQDATPV